MGKYIYAILICTKWTYLMAKINSSKRKYSLIIKIFNDVKTLKVFHKENGARN